MYGSRAANGVVVITTVAPKPGEVTVTYSLTGGVTFPDLSDYNLANAEEKLEIERLAGLYDLKKELQVSVNRILIGEGIRILQKEQIRIGFQSR